MAEENLIFYQYHILAKILSIKASDKIIVNTDSIHYNINNNKQDETN